MDGILCVDKPPEMTSFLCCAAAHHGKLEKLHSESSEPFQDSFLFRFKA